MPTKCLPRSPAFDRSTDNILNNFFGRPSSRRPSDVRIYLNLLESPVSYANPYFLRLMQKSSHALTPEERRSERTATGHQRRRRQPIPRVLAPMLNFNLTYSLMFRSFRSLLLLFSPHKQTHVIIPPPRTFNSFGSVSFTLRPAREGSKMGTPRRVGEGGGRGGGVVSRFLTRRRVSKFALGWYALNATMT